MTNPPHAFVPTQWSQVIASRGDDPVARAALAWLCERYWQPLCCHVMAKGWGPHSAADLTQDFFVHLIERDVVARADADRGRFRSYLLGCLDRFLAQQRRTAATAKRGGAIDHEALDHAEPVAPPGADVVAEFDAQWAGHVCRLAWARLSAEQTQSGAGQRFAALAGFVVEPASAGDYRAVAEKFGLSEVATKVAVHRLRQRYRELLEAEIRQTLAEPSARALDDEMAALFAAAAERGLKPGPVPVSTSAPEQLVQRSRLAKRSR